MVSPLHPSQAHASSTIEAMHDHSDMYLAPLAMQRIQQGRQQQAAAQGGGVAPASGGAAPAVYFPPHMRQGQQPQAAQAQAQQEGTPRMATFQGAADPALQNLQDFMDDDFEGRARLVSRQGQSASCRHAASHSILSYARDRI